MLPEGWVPLFHFYTFSGLGRKPDGVWRNQVISVENTTRENHSVRGGVNFPSNDLVGAQTFYDGFAFQADLVP